MSVYTPPSCMCWAVVSEEKSWFVAVGGWFHSPECESYRQRHPEMVVPDRRQGWRWSKEAIALYFSSPSQ